MKKHTQTLRQILAQVPASYPLVVKQGDTAFEVADVSFSHQPPQVLVRLVPEKLPEPEATIAELNEKPSAGAEILAAAATLNAAPVPEDGRSMTTKDGTYIPPAPTIGEQVIAAAKAKRTRKANPTV